MSEVAVKKGKKPEVIFVELVDMRDSGFVRDGTEGTKHEERLTAPSVHFIPNTSYRYIDQKLDNGETERVLEEIRHINKRSEISVMKQNAQGVRPSPRSFADKILIRNGRGSFAREGANIGMFDFIKSSIEFNESNPDLLAGAKPIYRIIDLQKQQEAQNELSMLQNEASAFVYALQEKKGGVWVYQQDKIDSLCNLFSIYAETPSMKIRLLSDIAKAYPKDFLDKVVKFEQISATVVSHALQLNVIQFTGNTAIYKNKDKVIKNLGTGKMDNAEKIELLSQYLRTQEGFEAFNELSAEVDFAKEKQSNE